MPHYLASPTVGLSDIVLRRRLLAIRAAVSLISAIAVSAAASAACLAGAPAAAPGAAKRPRTDLRGDPLPPGAFARLGTSRFLHGANIRSLAYSPDGRVLASSGDDALIHLWDPTTGKELKRLDGHKGPVWTIAFSPDGDRLASGGNDCTIRIWRVASGKEVRRLGPLQSDVTSIAFVRDGNHIFSGEQGGTVALWDIGRAVETRRIRGPGMRLSRIALASEGAILAVGSFDEPTTLYDVSSGRKMFQLADATPSPMPGRPGPARGRQPVGACSLTFSPDGRMLATASTDGKVRIWETVSGNERSAVGGQRGITFAVAFSPDGKQIAGSPVMNLARPFIWDVATGSARGGGELYGNCGEAIRFSPDGKTIATGGWSSRIQLWDAAAGDELSVSSGSSPIEVVSFRPDGGSVLTGHDDGTLREWDTDRGRPLRNIPAHRSPYACCALSYSGDGKSLLTVGNDGRLVTWEAGSLRKLREFGGKDILFENAVFSKDGNITAIGNPRAASVSRCYTLPTLKEVGPLEIPPRMYAHFFMSPRSRFIAWRPWANGESELRVWSGTSATPLSVFRCLHVRDASGLAFSQDERLLAVQGADKALHIYETATAKERSRLQGKGEDVMALALSSDCGLLAAGGRNGTVYVWELSDGKQLCCLMGHTQWVHSLAFSPDTKKLISGSQDGTAILWDLRPYFQQRRR